MGPTRDETTAAYFAEELRKVDHFVWDKVFAVWAVERAAAAARKRNGEDTTYFNRTREIACIATGLLYGQQPADVDWAAFEKDFDEILWSFDAADF